MYWILLIGSKIDQLLDEIVGFGTEYMTTSLSNGLKKTSLLLKLSWKNKSKLF